MPLTFAHPAAILPGYHWQKRGVPFAALIIGSMSPDFEYFLRLEPIGHFAHTIPGIFVFCLPMGLLAYGLYRTLLSSVLPALMPLMIRSRWPESALTGGWIKQYGAVSIALVLGALTHIVWDSFTHHSGIAVAYFPVLGAEVQGVPTYKILQHGSTLLGLLLIARWYCRLPVQEVVPQEGVSGKVYLLIAFAFVVFATILGYIHPPVTIGRVVVETIDSALLAVLTVSLWIRYRPKKSNE